MMMNPGIASDHDDDPEYSVRMLTDSGLVYLAEFRTHGEAVELAREAANRLEVPVTVCCCGSDVFQVTPDCCTPSVS